jgi:hypothetical protein
MRCLMSVILVLFLFSSSYGGLIGFWPLDEGTGDKVNDAAGNFGQGTIYGASFTTGIKGAALSFNGYCTYDPIDCQVEYFTIPHDDIIYSSPTKEITLTFWIKISNLDNSYSPFIFVKHNPENSSGILLGAINPDNNLEFRVFSPWGGPYLYYNNPQINTLYHLGLVISSSELILYINGQLVDSSPFMGINQNTYPFTFGAHPNMDNPFSGIIDEIKLYNHALTQDEILNDMNFIDTNPPNPNPLTWNSTPSAISSTSISMSVNSAIDAQTPPVSYYFDFMDSPTGGTGGNDSGWQSSSEYSNTGLQANHQYGYRVKARDSSPALNETTYSGLTYRYTYANPPQIASFSNIQKSSIQANWGSNQNRAGTEYYCENTRGTNSGWATNLNWNETGLTCGTNYTYRVRARNGDLSVTDWMTLGTQGTAPCDVEPPTPNPMSWETEPTAISPNAITMIASIASDSTTPPVNYYFNFVTSSTGGAGGADLGWTDSRTYTNTGLQPNHRYSYQVKARDFAPSLNETAYSETVSRFTFANHPGAGSFSNIGSITIRANWTANGNRTGTEYYCENITRGTNSNWTTNLSWLENNLEPDTTYTYRVKARNGDNVDLGEWTILGSQKTYQSIRPPTGFRIQNIASERLTLTWDPNTEPNLAGYKIFIGFSPKHYAYVIDAGNRTQSTVTITEGFSYYLNLTAYSEDGFESGFSVEIRYPPYAFNLFLPLIIDIN